MRTILALGVIAASAAGSVDLSSSGPGECTLVYRAGDPATVDCQGVTATTFEEAGLLFEPGRPMLPVERVYIPVPEGAAPVMSYRITGVSTFDAPRGGAPRAPLMTGTGLSTTESEAPPLDGPDRNVILAGVVPLAGFSFAAVDIYPWLGGAEGEYASEIRIDLSWDGGESASRAVRNPPSPASLVCPFDMPFYRLGTGSRAESPFWGRPWARISIGETGGYETSCSDLQSAGCDLEGVPSATLRLMTGPGGMFGAAPEEEHTLDEVAIEILDGGDGVFDSQDRIRFIARSLERWLPMAGGPVLQSHRWDDTNTYWLTWGGEPGKRIQPVPAAPDGSPQYGGTALFDVSLQEDMIWEPEMGGVTGWIWMSLPRGGSRYVDYSLDFPPAGSGGLEFWFGDDSSSTKIYSIFLDDDLIYDGSWSDNGTWSVEVPDIQIPRQGRFTIEVSSSSSQSFFLDRIHVRMPVQMTQAADRMIIPGVEKQGRFDFVMGPCDESSSIYILDDFLSPSSLQGCELSSSTASFSADISLGTHLIAMSEDGWMSPDSIAPASPGRLVGTVTGSDRLLVVPDVFADEMWGLLSLYESRGISCEVATTSEIFDEFGQGVADPGAIRSAVRWAMDSWEAQPGGVLLVGDGHCDPLGHTTSTPSLIFPWSDLGGIDYLSDDMYVMVHEDSDLPELPLARLPVQTAAELLTCTAKIVSGSNGASSGAWANRTLLIADDEWGRDLAGTYDEVEHTVDTERIAEEVVPRSVERTKFYLIEYPWSGSGTHPTKPEAREDILDVFSEGFAVVTYIGHGAANQIAHEALMYGSDVAQLTNAGRLPFSFWATCDVGHYDGVGDDAIAEKMILHPSGGSISCVAATRGSNGGSNYMLLRAMLDSLYADPGLSISEALWQTKILQEGSYYGNHRFYNVFGDLETTLPSPRGSIVMAVEGDTVRTGETNHISGTAALGSGVAFVELMESSSPVTYICRNGSEIDYLKYGGVAFRGSAAISGGGFDLDCLIPIQSVTGGYGRAGGSAPAPSSVHAGGEDPLEVVEGSPSPGDFDGPEVAMWIEGYEGVENPEVSGGLSLQATLADPSGICFLGGSGRQLTLFLDSEGDDVGRSFTYDQGSTTQGRLDHEVGTLPLGQHDLILWSFDGAGNSARDTLSVSVRAPGRIAISEALVYPNPGNGLRCFSFRLSEDASVEISVYTISGRRIATMESQCPQGYNQVLWDGSDGDGDIPATGAYVYRISAVATGVSAFESEADYSGVLAIVR